MKTQTILVQREAQRLWDSYFEIFPKLVKFDCPKIILSNRLTKTGGYNQSDANTVTLGYKFFKDFKENMLTVVLPHELAHQIDYNLNGWYAKRKHHNNHWCEIMMLIGLPPDPYHYMVL